MKVVLALAFLSVARAAFINKPTVEDALWHKTMDEMWKKHMIVDHNTYNPTYMMDFDSVKDIRPVHYLKDEMNKPSIVFFEGPDGKMVSYYAHEGIDNIKYLPEVRSAFSNLYGAADKVAVHFRPEDILAGHYKTVLPGHFFRPENDYELARFMSDMPMTNDFSSLKFAGKTAHPFKNFETNSLPYFYKEPVPLDMTKFLADASVFPATHGVTGLPVFSGANVVPFAKSAIAPTMGAGVSPFFKSALTPAYHLVKADFPFFSAAPATGLVDSSLMTSSLFKTDSPFFTSANSGLTFAPIHASGIIPTSAGAPSLVKADSPFFTSANSGLAFAPITTSGIIPASAGAASLFKAVPCEGCLVAGDHVFRSAIPTTFGTHPYSSLFKTVPLTSAVIPASAAFPATSAFGPAHTFIPLNY